MSNTKDDVVKKTETDLLTCAICLEDITSKKARCTLECDHTFCTKCVLRWIDKHNTCPCCRDVVMDYSYKKIWKLVQLGPDNEDLEFMSMDYEQNIMEGTSIEGILMRYSDRLQDLTLQVANIRQNL